MLAAASAAALAAGASDVVSVADPYARAVPPGQPNGALFMRLSNPSRQIHALVGAESSVADVVELHGHFMEDGMMKMRRVRRIELPPGEDVALEPGGLHLMLIGLERPLAPEQEVDLTLVFEDGSRVRLTAPVRGAGAGAAGLGGGHRCGGGRCGADR
jgi:copper(I)-binding protein